MNPVVRALAVYLFLLLIFRILGRRSLSEITTFDFVMLLIIGEVTQQALLGPDYSITNALLLITALVGIDLALAKLKGHSRRFEKLLEGTPLIVVDKGKALKNRMTKAGIDEHDILEAARLAHGLERMEQIKYAVQERDGSISIIPWRDEQE